MRILLIATAFNSLAQRVYAELGDEGHELEVVIAACGVGEVRETVFGPGGAPDAAPRFDLCIAPMLTTAIPEDVWRALPCLIVHPGPVGDRGPASLDWALHLGAETWGVTVLQAVAAMDAGPVWATAGFRIPPGVSKSELYRGELADAASTAVHEAVRRFAAGLRPRPQRDSVTRGGFPQRLRRIDWAADSTEHVSALLRAADSSPGVLDRVHGREYHLYGGEPEYALRGRSGTLLATRTGAVCRATADGAVWISHAKPKRVPGGPAGVKLPAALTLSGHVGHLPECPGSPEIAYRERGEVGMLSFGFPGGALSTEHCRRLLKALRHASTRRTRVLVLGGRRDFFGNGIHLGVIEAAADPAAESWANINAIDDVVEAVLRMTDRMVVAAMGGNAAAGSAVLGFAADEVWLRRGAVLNPHYRLMGLGRRGPGGLHRDRVGRRVRAGREAGHHHADSAEGEAAGRGRGSPSPRTLPAGRAGQDARDLRRPGLGVPRAARRVRAQGGAGPYPGAPQDRDAAGGVAHGGVKPVARAARLRQDRTV